jgi:rubrerythrin
MKKEMLSILVCDAAGFGVDADIIEKDEKSKWTWFCNTCDDGVSHTIEIEGEPGEYSDTCPTCGEEFRMKIVPLS